MDKMDSLLTKTLALAGTLRASINLGNLMLAKREPSTGQPVRRLKISFAII